MKGKLRYYLIAVVVLAAAAFLVVQRFQGNRTAGYAFAEVARGHLEVTVSATGTLSPLTSVQVGTQVSGTIDSVYVDYNDEVHEGQVLAVLDTSLLRAAVYDAAANVERSEAQVDQAQADFDRTKALYDRGLIPEADFLTQKATLKMQNATLKSARAALDRARQNLTYAVICSPIDGIVIDRSVDAGQTVAASLSTPTLFVIAQDLSRMEVLAEVDESDIGTIRQGQTVRFEVAAYSDEEFTGVVKQVRLQPTVVSNVVTYTVVVEASNEKDLLLPGMTATLELITDECDDCLLVPNKALRFQPPEAEVQAFWERRRSEREASGERPTGSVPSAADTAGARPAQAGRPKDAGMVWYVDTSGQLAAARLRTGLTDGKNTQVVASRDLTEGMKIITGEESDNATTANNQMSGPPGGFMGPRRGF